MAPPEAPGDGTAARRESPPAVSSLPPLETLRNRADFLAAARGRHARAPGLILQGRERDDGTATIRVGFTCSKKVGNAVARNRARRRLRAAAREILPRRGRPGWDYVLIGRAEVTAARPWADLLADLETALARLHRDHP